MEISLEQIKSKKKKDRSDEEQIIFIKEKRKQYNKKYVSKPNINIEEKKENKFIEKKENKLIEKEEQIENILDDSMEEYLEYRLQLLFDKKFSEKNDNVEIIKPTNASEENSFLEIRLSNG